MQNIFSLNYRLSSSIGENLYINTYPIDRNQYLENTTFIDIWDKSCNKVVISHEHKYLNEYNYYINNNEFYKEVSIKSSIPNDKSSDKCILFFVCYDEVPFEINLNECIYKLVNILLIKQSIDIIVKQIETVAEEYPNSTIIVTSSLCKYATNIGKKNDILQKKLFDINLDNVVYDTTFDIDTIDNDKFLTVITNKESYLFVHCFEKEIPVISLDKVNTKVLDKQICKYFSNIDSESLYIYDITESEFDIQNYDEDMDYEFDNNKIKLLSNKLYINSTFFDKEISTFDKIHLYQDAVMLKNMFSSEENTKLITLTNNIEDENTLIVTMNLYNSFHSRCRKNKNRHLNWLCFDYDTLHQPNEEKYMRYYFQSYANRKPIYNFNNLDELKTKFGIDNIKEIDYDVNGKILLILDNPYGPNYSSETHWVKSWTNIFEKLSVLNKEILIKPYSKYSVKQKEIDTLFLDNFSKYQNVTYATDLLYTDLSTIINTNNIYFAVKRQGTDFLKSYVNGIIMISGLTKSELNVKPDGKFVNEYEYTLSDVMYDIDNKLKEIKETYNINTFDNLKKMTANFVAIEDIQNGLLLKGLKLN